VTLYDEDHAKGAFPMFLSSRSFVTGIALLFALCSVAARGDMMKDSPVKFPKNGALPSKYPPDVRTWHESPEKDYAIFGTPQRSLAQIEKIQAEMVKGKFTRPKPDWTHLKRTRRILTEGSELHVLALGDSIVNDTMRSAWLAKLAEAYPRAKIRGTVYVRGGGGCQHYKEVLPGLQWVVYSVRMVTSGGSFCHA
jgi:hypothetical protein